jgi:periplasmic protein TonB
MSATALVSFRTSALAWTDTPDDERLFQRVTRTVLAITVLVCLALLMWPKPQPDRSQPQALPPRMAKLLLEHTPPPPPIVKPPVAAPAEAKRQTQADEAQTEQSQPVAPKSEPRRAQLRPREDEALAVPEARVPVDNKPAGEVLAARRKASGMGLLAASDEIAQLRGAPAAVQLRTDIKQGAGVGSGSGPGVGAGTEAGVPTRSVITSNATGGSGGINTAALSRNTGGGGLAGRATTLVEGAAGGGGGGGTGGGGVGSGRATDGAAGGTGVGAGAGKAGASAKKGSRSNEDIKLVFERNKGAIYAIYNRALREDPTLQGKVTLELKIAPSGEVLACRIVSSDLKAPELEAKLMARIRQFDFGAKDVEPMVVTWPVDFLPS